MNKCDRCGEESYLNKELLSIYKTSIIKQLCPCCASQANSYVNYCGIKKDNDVADLKKFLVSGVKSIKAYDAMMGGGYF